MWHCSASREPRAAGDSALVRYLETEGPSTNLAISHIRHATRGSIQLSNTQPFVRELGGHSHVFAHNGDLPGIEANAALAMGPYLPVGQTDSERAFCALLTRMQVLWANVKQDGAPSLQDRMALLAAFAADLRALGPANFLYADGDALFAHSDRRMQRGRPRPEPPGLWTLQRHCAPADPPLDERAGVSVAPEARVAVFIASVPLTGEAWRPMAEGELVAVRNGEVLVTPLPVAP